MSKRTPIHVKPRATVSEIVEQDRIIRFGFEARVGAPLPMPLREKPDHRTMSDMAKYIEERIAKTVNEFARNGIKGKYLTQGQRDIFWKEMEYGRAQLDSEATAEEEENMKWDAYCLLIGIPAASRIGNMFQMLPDDRHPVREWPMEVIMSVTTGKLMCEDLAQFAEFMVWFAGGWPDTFAGELDKKKAQKLFVSCAAASLQLQWEMMGLKVYPKRLPEAQDVAKMTPANKIVTLPVLMNQYPKTLAIFPANFTELMAFSGAT